MTAPQPISVIIYALGGQGGGVLSDWLVEAAHLAGYRAQGTSIPGVAQRTGATNYYVEIYPEREPDADPVFCLFPSAGDVDLVVSLEPMETGRALNAGYVTLETTVVTARDRIYSIGEKVVPGDGTASASPVLTALEAAAKKLVSLDIGAMRERPNATFFGAIAATGVLPFEKDSCRQAISATGIAVESNLAGFEAGLVAASAPERSDDEDPATAPETAPPSLAELTAQFPQQLRAVVDQAISRLIDYQDEAYARLFVDRLRMVYAADESAGGAIQEFRLACAIAPRLAAWMAFEDVIRVAQLKTRPERLRRIREECGASAGEIVRVVDFLKPGRAEFAGLLPAWIGRRLSRPESGRPRGGIAFKITTSAPWGYALLKVLAGLRPLRRGMMRYADEQDAIDRWIEAVVGVASSDYELACRLVDVARWVRGYGDVRDRGLSRMEALCIDWREKLADDPAALSVEITRALDEALLSPDSNCAPVA